LFEELDKIAIRTHGEEFADGKPVGNMEHSVLENLLMPGQNRCNMPQTPQNSEAVRKSNLNEMKAFCSIETEAMERGLKLKDFE
jgi:hypothetical protein